MPDEEVQDPPYRVAFLNAQGAIEAMSSSFLEELNWRDQKINELAEALDFVKAEKEAVGQKVKKKRKEIAELKLAKAALEQRMRRSRKNSQNTVENLVKKAVAKVREVTRNKYLAL